METKPQILVLAAALLFAMAPSSCWAQVWWTNPSDVRAITGRGDMLFGATGGGLVTWTLPLGDPQVLGSMHGIASNDILGVHLNPAYDELLLRTSNGLARGWPGTSWETLFAQQDGSGRNFSAAIAMPNGAWLLGDDSGELLAWKQANTEWLSIPTRSRVTDLAYSDTWGERFALPHASGGATRQTASLFVPGLLCTTEDDGLWLLRSTQPLRWLRIGEQEGLPSEQLMHVAIDDSAYVWLATRAGIARLNLQLQIAHWPAHPYLSQRGLTLFSGPSVHLYVGWWGGLFRIVTVAYDDDLQKPVAPTVEAMPGIHQPILSVAWAQALWWTDGDSLNSLLGATLHPPMGLADNHVLSIASRGSEIWLGHPDGHMSRVQTEPGRSGAASLETWQHFSPQDGLPQSNLNCLWFHDGTLFVGSEDGLFQQSGLGTGPRFQTVVQLPPEEVRAQATWRGSHWVGGEAGLWESNGSGWWRVPLWPGASEVQSICATAETLWVAAGTGGIAARVGHSWVEPQRAPALAEASFQHIVAAQDGVVYIATDAGVALLRNQQVDLLDDPSPTDIQCLLWQGETLYAGTGNGLFRWTASGVWHYSGILDRLPGANTLALASTSWNSLSIGSTQGYAALPLQRQTTDASQPEHKRTNVVSPPTVCLIASRQGDRLRVPIPHEGTRHMRLFDVHGRYLNDWHVDEAGFLTSRTRTPGGQRISRGLYVGRVQLQDRGTQLLRVLITQ